VVAEALQAQNGMTPAGTVISAQRNLPLRLTGSFDSVESMANLAVRVEGRTLRVGDFAKVTRGYIDPSEFKMRFNGKEVIGLGVTMNKTGDVLELGKALGSDHEPNRGGTSCRIEVQRVADQSRVVKTAIGEFTRTFFRGLGGGAARQLSEPRLSHRLRGRAHGAPGSGRHAVMYAAIWDGNASYLAGSLILALGLLVDDAMIAIEMMARKLEEGWDRMRAATHAYRCHGVSDADRNLNHHCGLSAGRSREVRSR
jgi:Cation/multidrug efflux pump